MCFCFQKIFCKNKNKNKNNNTSKKLDFYKFTKNIIIKYTSIERMLKLLFQVEKMKLLIMKNEDLRIEIPYNACDKL